MHTIASKCIIDLLVKSFYILVRYKITESDTSTLVRSVWKKNMSIRKVGVNLYIAQGFALGHFFSARGITAIDCLNNLFVEIAIKRSVLAWK